MTSEARISHGSETQHCYCPSFCSAIVVSSSYMQQTACMVGSLYCPAIKNTQCRRPGIPWSSIHKTYEKEEDGEK